jgi:hypothetical protein
MTKQALNYLLGSFERSGYLGAVRTRAPSG